jgi:hypothetical protein
MAGALRAVFGVCANEWSPSDGGVVSLDHGCGAHSETDVEQVEAPAPTPIVDEFAVDLEPTPATEEAEEAEEAPATQETAEPREVVGEGTQPVEEPASEQD